MLKLIRILSNVGVQNVVLIYVHCIQYNCVYEYKYKLLFFIQTFFTNKK